MNNAKLDDFTVREARVMHEQRPKVRALLACICCGEVKGKDLLLCWPCHSLQKRTYGGGYDPRLDRVFELVERELIDAAGAFATYNELFRRRRGDR